MADVKWIRLAIDIFDNRKIRYIRRQYPQEGNAIILAWLMLLTLAGKINDGGMVYIMPHIPHDEGSLSEEFGIEISIIKKALDVFVYLHMIEHDGCHIRICGWEEYQSADRLQELREQHREAQRRHRAKQKSIVNDSDMTVINDGDMTVTSRHKTEVEVEREEDKELDLEGSSSKVTATTANITYSDLCKKYGTAFVRERIERGKTYHGITLDTIAKWCEEDYTKAQERRKSRKTGFTKMEQRTDYDMQAIESAIIANDKPKEE